MNDVVTQRGIEAIAVKRAVVTDSDKVRYRVYRTESDFVAVIAESALMAVKVSGIAEPLRIVRDLPTEGVTLGSERLNKEGKEERVSLALKAKEAPTNKRVVDKLEMAQAAQKAEGAFMPMKLRDLQKSVTAGMSVLARDAVETVTSLRPAPPAAVAPIEAPLPPPPALEPVAEIAQPATAPAEAAPAAPAEEALSPEEVDTLLKS